MSRVARKSGIEVFDQVQHKPGCTTAEDGEWLEISWIVLSMFRKHCTVTAQLICAFVFTYAKSRFSYDMAVMSDRDLHEKTCAFDSAT